MNNITTINVGKMTPQQALLTAMEIIEDIEHLVVIYEKKNGGIDASWSNMQMRDFSHMVMSFNDLARRERDNLAPGD